MKSAPADFLDTNVLIYAFTGDARAAAAQALLERNCAISVQGLNEFANVARRKLGMSWGEIGRAVSSIRTLCPLVVPIEVKTHEDALRIADRYGYPIFDALVIASALLARSDILWSEDMQDGLIIDERLRITNPFRVGS